MNSADFPWMSLAIYSFANLMVKADQKIQQARMMKKDGVVFEESPQTGSRAFAQNEAQFRARELTQVQSRDYTWNKRNKKTLSCSSGIIAVLPERKKTSAGCDTSSNHPPALLLQLRRHQLRAAVSQNGALQCRRVVPIK